MDLLPVEAKRGLAAVLAHGAEKYGAHNWRKGMAWSRLIAAAHRHLDAFTNGEDVDEEGIAHIDCLQACAAFLSTYQKLALGDDDRWKGEPEPESPPVEVSLCRDGDIVGNEVTGQYRSKFGLVKAPPSDIGGPR